MLRQPWPSPRSTSRDFPNPNSPEDIRLNEPTKPARRVSKMERGSGAEGQN